MGISPNLNRIKNLPIWVACTHQARVSRNRHVRIAALHHWLKMTPKEVSDKICKLSRKGLRPSEIGVLLRDQYGVGQITNVTGSEVLRILRSKGNIFLFCFFCFFL